MLGLVKRKLNLLNRVSITGWLKKLAPLIGQWRRRLECVVQQQGSNIEHLMQKLHDVTVTLGNN